MLYDYNILDTVSYKKKLSLSVKVMKDIYSPKDSLLLLSLTRDFVMRKDDRNKLRTAIDEDNIL